MELIYNIVDNTNNNVYVGKTNNMKTRMQKHISDMKSEKYYCSSEIVLKNNDWTEIIIEDNLSEEDAYHREIYYIQNTPNCINQIKYNFDKKSWGKEYNKNRKNKDVILKRKKEYYQKNKEKMNKQNKENYEKKVIKSVLDNIISQIELDYS